MRDIDWVKFFDLMDKIINQPGSANEKIAEFRAKAEEHDANLEEFACYLPSE